MNSEILSQMLKEIIKDNKKMKEMGEAALKIAMPNVLDKIYEEIKSVKL